MKKLFFILAVAATFTACNDTETKVEVNTDSIAAAATADSLAAIKAAADTSMKMMDSASMKMDSAATKMMADSTKK